MQQKMWWIFCVCRPCCHLLWRFFAETHKLLLEFYSPRGFFFVAVLICVLHDFGSLLDPRKKTSMRLFQSEESGSSNRKGYSDDDEATFFWNVSSILREKTYLPNRARLHLNFPVPLPWPFDFPIMNVCKRGVDYFSYRVDQFTRAHWALIQTKLTSKCYRQNQKKGLAFFKLGICCCCCFHIINRSMWESLKNCVVKQFFLY